jgi:D-alanyl-D-alanine carboxypeptidase (penicillin-binding protein 5/6)
MRNGKKKAIALSLTFICIVVIAYVIYCAVRTIPIPPPATITRSITPTTSSQIAWPSTGQSAVAVAGNPVVTSHGVQTPTPTASVAKLITSLVVLQAKPLSVGQQGPAITLTASDVAIYRQYLSEQGSVVPVEAGESITEYQMLQAMLLPSANNMADSLAIWAFG